MDAKLEEITKLAKEYIDAGNYSIPGSMEWELAVWVHMFIAEYVQRERAEKEAEWLAAKCHKFCDYNSYCNECALYPGEINFPHPDCGEKITRRFEKHTVNDWRENARKAVKKEK